MITLERPGRRAALAGATAALLLGSLAGCGDDSSDLPPPATSPGASPADPADPPALSPEDAAAAEEILAAFDAYMDVLIELSTAGVPGGTDETTARLEEAPVGGEAILELAFDLLTPNFLAGHATRGTISWEAELDSIDWQHRYEHRPENVVPLAIVKACIDETDWITIDTESGDIVAGPGTRYRSEITVTWRDEDPDRPEMQSRWQVAFREDGPEPC